MTAACSRSHFTCSGAAMTDCIYLEGDPGGMDHSYRVHGIWQISLELEFLGKDSWKQVDLESGLDGGQSVLCS